MIDPQLVVLPEMPSLAKLYMNAAATAAKRRVLRSEGSAEVPAVRHEVHGICADVAKLTDFQHLVGKSAPDVLPSGFLHAMTFPVAMSVMNRDDFPLPLLGIIHLKNQVEHMAPVLYTQPLTIRAWAQTLMGHRTGTQVDVVAEVRADDGDAVLWRGVSTYLAKGIFFPGLDKSSAISTVSDFRAPDPTGLWHLGVDTGRAYGAVSGDFNPIHLSVLTAKALGMRRSIAHGMYLGSRILADVGSAKADTFAWDIGFEAPVFLPATVAVHIEDHFSVDDVWQGAHYSAWNPHSGRRHFTGSVTPL